MQPSEVCSHHGPSHWDRLASRDASNVGHVCLSSYAVDNEVDEHTTLIQWSIAPYLTDTVHLTIR